MNYLLLILLLLCIYLNLDFLSHHRCSYIMYVYYPVNNVFIMSDPINTYLISLHGRTVANMMLQLIGNYTSLLADLVHTYIIPFIQIVENLHVLNAPTSSDSTISNPDDSVSSKMNDSTSSKSDDNE